MVYLFATYYYHRRADTTPEHAAQALAGEEMTGTWTGTDVDRSSGAAT